MTDVRSLRVFLGSSITELEKERVSISDSISQDLTHLFEQDNIIIQFLKCDSIHEGNSGQHDQEKIDAMLRTCDVSLFLFKDKEGEYTLHEYEVARALQQERNHKIYVYYLLEGDKKKPEKLTPFQERIEKDGVHWKKCDSLSDLKYQFAMGLLKNLGVRCGEIVRAAGEVKKDAEALFEQTQLDHQLMHQEIEKLLAQVDPVMKDTDTPISARITQVMGFYLKADLWASKTDYDKEKYSNLLFKYAQFSYKYGLYRDSEEVYLRQISLAEELYGNEHEKTATSYNEIGVVYKAQGDYPNALKYYLKALVIDEKVLGTEQLVTAIDYNNIGIVYDDQGDYPKALEYYMKALAIQEKVLGTEDPATAIDYNNIGGVYKSQGNYAKALEYYSKALVIKEKTIGTEHPSTATTYNNIGGMYKSQGDYPKALEYYSKSLAIKEKILGTEHPSTATSYNNVGWVYMAQGDYPKAMENYYKALAIREKVLNSNHPDTAQSYNNIGALYYDMKKYTAALDCFEKALKIVKEIYGANHPITRKTQRWIDKVRTAMENEQ